MTTQASLDRHMEIIADAQDELFLFAQALQLSTDIIEIDGLAKRIASLAARITYRTNEAHNDMRKINKARAESTPEAI